MNPELFLCECSSAEHQLIVTKDNDYVYFQLHLAMLPWWKRLILGVKYIFGYRSKYGDFDEIIFNPETARKLGATLVSIRSVSHGTTRVGPTERHETGTQQ